MLEALSDREWHSQYELINRASRYVKPEAVSKKYYQNTKRKQPAKTDVNLAVYYGLKHLVRRALTQLRVRELVEYRGPLQSDDREVRFTGWYCWNCGRLKSSPKPDHGRCGACPIHCWNCGSPIDDPKCIDDELCAKCQKIHNEIEDLKGARKFADEEEIQLAIRKEIMSRPTRPRFMPIEAEEPEEPKRPREIVQQVLEEPDDGGTIVYHSTVKLKRKKRKPPKPPKPPKPKESKPKKRRARKVKKEARQIEPPPERLLLTYDPDLFKPVDVGALPELMGVAVKHPH
jgi:hypothetical protein